MSEPRSTRRRRRTGGATRIPKWIALWFAGERPYSFTATTPPHRYVLGDYWAAWKEDHPDAVPPDNLLPYLREPVAGSRAAAMRDGARKALGLVPD